MPNGRPVHHSDLFTPLQHKNTHARFRIRPLHKVFPLFPPGVKLRSIYGELGIFQMNDHPLTRYRGRAYSFSMRPYLPVTVKALCYGSYCTLPDKLNIIAPARPFLISRMQRRKLFFHHLVQCKLWATKDDNQEALILDIVDAGER